MIGCAPVSRDVDVGGQLYTVDVRVLRPETPGATVIIEAVACGYNSQSTQRFEERIEVAT
ncbi:MAG TPA: hypothetical protein VFS35_06490 [Terrimicrobiaceae bacterium]|nr:hypothetical protein [Terrimicrobiaceae bacterium]